MSEAGGVPRPQEPHNTVYEKLAGSDADLEGMVAYAIYKKMKREWIIRENPSAADIAKFHTTVTPTQLELCRSLASAKLSAFAAAAIEESADSYKQQGAEAAIVATVKQQQSFLGNLGVNVLGSFVFTVLLLILWVALNLIPSTQDIGGKISALFRSAPSEQQSLPRTTDGLLPPSTSQETP